MKKNIRLYFRLIRVHLLASLEYRGWWLQLIQLIVLTMAEPFGIMLMFMRFGRVGSWSAERILVIYALAITSYGLAQAFSRGFEQFASNMIRTGNFDRVLLRPKSLMVQTAASVFLVHRLARPAAGIAVILLCLARMGVALTPVNLLILALALAGGTALYTGVFVFASGVAFFTIKALDWVVVLTNASYQVTRIPHEYIPAMLRRAFTFLMPMLVISYYPAAAVCGWGERLWTGFLALPAGLLFLGAATLMWRAGVRHYTSTGS